MCRACHRRHGLATRGILAAGSDGRSVRAARWWRTGPTTGLLQLHELTRRHGLAHATRHASRTGGRCGTTIAVTATASGTITANRLADEFEGVACSRTARTGATGIGSTSTWTGGSSRALRRTRTLGHARTLVLCAWLCGTRTHARSLATTGLGGGTCGPLGLGATHQLGFGRWPLRRRGAALHRWRCRGPWCTAGLGLNGAGAWGEWLAGRGFGAGGSRARWRCRGFAGSAGFGRRRCSCGAGRRGFCRSGRLGRSGCRAAHRGTGCCLACNRLLWRRRGSWFDSGTRS